MTQEDTHPTVTPTPPAGSKSAIGKVSDLGAGEILLPDFVTDDAQGVRINPRTMAGAAQMQRFVDRVFSAGAYFVGLDHAALAGLLFSANTENTPGKKEMLRIADAIAVFGEARRALYKSPKSVDDGARMVYLFEPVWLERIVEVPIFGVMDEAGQPVLTGHEKQVQREATKLDVDEFVAAMWSCGVRSGIDIAAVRAGIEAGHGERVEIARRLDPAPGVDATVQEQTQALHRDDSPSILPSGKMDLRHFKNHFPQVAAGTRLLQKQPRQPGVPGLDTDGTVLEPDLPRDFELEDMAGPGTRVERTAKGEFLVAARDGFLNIDTHSQQISITEKIVNRDGVSQRTTGNLILVGDYYEEHGEVQEHRLVEGRHMKFHADVFGGIVSHGGEVHLFGNLAGGSVKNAGGTIRIDGRTSRAVIDARDGALQAAYAESSTIVVAKLKLGQAIACDIVAEEVEIDEATGCTIAARRIRIRRVGSRRDTETLLTVCVPDFAALDKRRAEARKAVDGLRGRVQAKQAMIDERTANGEIRNYLAAEQRIKSGAVTLTPAQDLQWLKASQKVARPLFEIQTLQSEIETLNVALGEREAELSEMDRQRQQAGTDIGCEVAQVAGSVAVQTIAVAPDDAVLAGTEIKKLKHALRDTLKVRQRLFQGESGRFAWALKPLSET